MIAAIKRRVGSAILGAVRMFYRTGKPADLRTLQAQRILVVQGLRIGDTVATLPAIAALRERWPEAEVVSLAPPPATEVLAMSGLIDTMLSWPQDGSRLRNGKRALADVGDLSIAVVFDCTLTSMLVADRAGAAASIGYDSHNRGFGLTHPVRPPPYWNRPAREYAEGTAVEPQFRSWLRLLREAGIDAEGACPQLSPQPEDAAWARAFVPDHGTDPVVVLHAGAEPSYRWDPDRFAAVGDHLCQETGAIVVLTGGPGDRDLVRDISDRMQGEPLLAAGHTTLGQMAALLAEAGLLVSVDTSAGHLAAAVGTPVISLFGPGDPRIWAPQGERVTVLTADGVDCLGCKADRCRKDGHPCMAGIQVDDVLAAARAILMA